MKKQLNYMTAMNLGFDHERLLEIAMNSSGEVSDSVLQKFKNEIEQNNNKMILGVSAAATPYGTFWARIGVETVEKERSWR